MDGFERPGAGPHTAERPRPLRTVLIAGLTALVVGVPAGYGGSVLADRAGMREEDTPAPSSTGLGAEFDDANPLSRAQRSAVGVETSGEGAGSIGAGVVWDDQGHIVTNRHVVSSDGEAVVTSPTGERTAAEVVGYTQAYDLAVLRIDTDVFDDTIRPADRAEDYRPTVGDRVYAIGAPHGLDATVSSGIVSAINRAIEVAPPPEGEDGPPPYLRAIQVDAPMNPGNSGGPLVNGQGELIGVNAAILTGDGEVGTGGDIGLGFAIPVDQAAPIVEALIADGQYEYPISGITAVATSSGAGVEVDSVEEASPADAAGLEAGDTILTVAGTPVHKASAFEVAIRAHRPGDVVELTVLRGDTEESRQLTLDGAVG